MKAEKINCKLCGKKVTVDFVSKWRHMINKHPDVAFKNIVPLLENPEAAYSLGASLAQKLRGLA